MPRSLRLGFAGTPQFAVPALEALCAGTHQVVAVFTQPDRPAGRGRAVQQSPVKLRALQAGLRVLQPTSFKTPAAAAALAELQLDALVVVAYGQLLPAAVLALPALGCYNIHASLLPRWRGAAPIQRAILAGDRTTGVSIMRMEAGLDTGPVLLSHALDIGPLETAGELHDRLAACGAQLIVRALGAVAAGSSHAVVQPGVGVTYAHKISKAEAAIDWSDPAAAVLRRVRAFNPWPVAETHWEGSQLRIWDAEIAPTVAPVAALPGAVFEQSTAGIDVACGDGALRIVRLQLAGRKALSCAEFLKAQTLAGARFLAS